MSAPAQPQPQQPAPPVVAPFALAPGLVDISAPIDYSTRVGSHLYSAGTRSLPIPFDGEIENVSTFVDGLLARAREMGWTHPQASISALTVTRDGQQVNLNLIEEYGRYTLPELRVHVLTYYDQASRRAQYANMMYYCILNSITENANNRVINEQDQYVINGISSGPMLFKFLMNVITIDTRATVTNLRMDLSTLDTYIPIVQFDIDKFNLHVKEKRKQLRNRGETSQDVLINLFKAYEMVPDTTFRNWLIRKKENYEEGADVTPDSLMLDALNRYQSLVREGKWQTKSPESKRIMALTAQVDEMEKLLKGTKFKFKNQGSKPKWKDGKASKQPSKKKIMRDLDAWKKIPPKEGEPSTKKYKNKEFNWCNEHMAWGRHQENDCELKKKRMAKQSNNSDTTNHVSNSVTVHHDQATKSLLDSMAAILSSE